MPDGSRIAIAKLKLLMFCHSLADTDLTAVNLTTHQQQLSVVTMLPGPVGLRMKDSDKMWCFMKSESWYTADTEGYPGRPKVCGKTAQL